MTKDFTESFINLGGRGFCPNRSPKFSFNHAKGSLSIRPLMVMLQERFPIGVVEMPHMIPQPVKLMMVVSHACRIGLEGNIGCATNSLSSLEIFSIGVGFVGGDFIDGECLGSLIHQSWELESISRFIGGGLCARYNVRSHTANQVSLYPSLLAAFLAVFVVKPPSVSGSSEARGINSEISLYGSQWTCTFLNKGFEQ